MSMRRCGRRRPRLPARRRSCGTRKRGCASRRRDGERRRERRWAHTRRSTRQRRPRGRRERRDPVSEPHRVSTWGRVRRAPATSAHWDASSTDVTMSAASRCDTHVDRPRLDRFSAIFKGHQTHAGFIFVFIFDVTAFGKILLFIFIIIYFIFVFSIIIII